jgi:hypothetical protein
MRLVTTRTAPSMLPATSIWMLRKRQWHCNSQRLSSKMQWRPLAPLSLPHPVCWNGAPGLIEPSFAGEYGGSGQVHSNVKVSDHYPISFISTG